MDDYLLYVILIDVVLGVVPAMIADKKGYSFLLWYLFGLLLFIVALPIILLLDPVNQKKCPECAELVKPDAARCRFCGHQFGVATKARVGLIRCPSCRREVPATLPRCTFCRHSLRLPERGHSQSGAA